MSLRHEDLQEDEVREVLVRRGEQEFDIRERTPLAPARAQPRPRPWIVLGLAALVLFALPRIPSVLHSVPRFLGPVTVPVGSVSYGPDVSPGAVVDPSFRPFGPLPHGFSLAATVGHTIWGCGDHTGTGTQPPDGFAAAEVEARLLELASYVRDHANPAEAFPPAFSPEPAFRTDLPFLYVNVDLRWRNGSSGVGLPVPRAADARAQKELRRLVHVAAKRLTDSTADSIQWMRANDPSLP